ncbi:MAG: hypothetical protein QM820_26705 [Minicystis sp.]
MGELARAGGETAVGDRLVAAHQGLGLGRAARLRGEELVQTRILREGHGRVVPPGEEASPLLGREERKRGDLPRRIGGRRAQERLELSGHPRDGGGVEEIGVVVERGEEARGGLHHDEAEVELGRLGGHLGRAEVGILGGARGAEGRVVEPEGHLDERAMAQAPLGRDLLHQPLEGQILVRIGRQGDVPHPPHEIAEGGVAVEVEAEGEQVHEEPDEPLQLRAGAVGDGRADHHIGRPRAAGHEHGIGREQDHERGRPDRAPERLNSLLEGDRQAEGVCRAAEGLHRRAGPIGGQIEERGGAAEVGSPEIQVSRERFPIEGLTLPDGEVGILNGQLRERGGQALAERVLEEGELAKEDPERPAVRDDVMKRDEENLVVVGELDDLGPEERAAGEIEGEPGLLGGEARRFRLALRRGEVGEVHHRERDPE